MCLTNFITSARVVTSPWAGDVDCTCCVLRLIYLSPDDAYIVRGVPDETLIHQAPSLRLVWVPFASRRRDGSRW